MPSEEMQAGEQDCGELCPPVPFFGRKKLLVSSLGMFPRVFQDGVLPSGSDQKREAG